MHNEVEEILSLMSQNSSSRNGDRIKKLCDKIHQTSENKSFTINTDFGLL